MKLRMQYRNRANVMGLSVALLWSSVGLAAPEHKTLTLDARDLQVLRIDVDEGFLHVQGVPGTDQIEVVAEIETNRQPHRLTLEKTGQTGKLDADIDGSGWFFSGRSYINLTVKVPDRLALVIEDDSGKIEISGMRSEVEIEDDSGDIEVRNHQGKLSIDDDSGKIDVHSLSGDLRVEDDSGGIAIRDVTGNVEIRDDSGPIHVNNVSGRVAIHDQSGPIDVSNVKQGLTIYNDGSGRLTTDAILGGIDIRD